MSKHHDQILDNKKGFHYAIEYAINFEYNLWLKIIKMTHYERDENFSKSFRLEKDYAVAETMKLLILDESM